ncbi:uncharacterized protein LOC121788563 isoform X2 [Salvia splendens]|uniref:uncharacterized protein LOC121788563 isoform X2 n=1 Tax=Salvia splendens TaxID=180675 RepID=UPI001C260BC4|nr:uncharacterized protein LOC121788563 isoform X2 [Salvia splendens]
MFAIILQDLSVIPTDVSGAFPMEICEEEKEVLPESGDSTSQDHVVVDSVKSHCRINETRDGRLRQANISSAAARPCLALKIEVV